MNERCAGRETSSSLGSSTWTHHAPRAVFTAPPIDRIRRRSFNSNGIEATPFPRRLDCNGRPGTKRSVRPSPRRKHRLKLAKAKRRPHAAIRTSGNGRPHRLSASGLSSIIREPRRWWITIHRYWVLLKNSRYWGVFPAMGAGFFDEKKAFSRLGGAGRVRGMPSASRVAGLSLGAVHPHPRPLSRQRERG